MTEPAGKTFHPEFQPELTPREMLEMEVFGGKYMTDCREEFPESRFSGFSFGTSTYSFFPHNLDTKYGLF